MLQDGAVLGKTFTQARAQRALGARGSRARAAARRRSSRKEVLGVQADPRSPEHGQYGFLQDLVRHVAYETLSKRERKARHLAAAAHLDARRSPTRTRSPRCSPRTTSRPSMPRPTRTTPAEIRAQGVQRCSAGG